LSAQRLGLKNIQLKKRLGVVPSKSGMNIDETEIETPDVTAADAGKPDGTD